MDAWDHCIRGMWRYYQFSPEDHGRAEQLMRRAIDLDPTFAQGHSALSRVLASKIVFGWSDDVEADRRASHAAARRAVDLDDSDPYAHYALAWPSLLLREHDSAIVEAQKAIDLTPNFALAYFGLGAARVFLGRFEQAADPFQRAMRLSPHEPLSFLFFHFLALAEYHQGRYLEAATIARRGIDARPFHVLYRTLAACYGQLGRADEAAAALAELRRFMPKDAERRWDAANPYADPAHRAHFLDGLHKAGWTRS
jgi:tetratricopeptide (TPR) repeat protein